MNNTPNIYHKDNCYKTKIIQTLNQFLEVKINYVAVDNLTETDRTKLLLKSPTGSLPLLQVGDSFLSGTRAILKYLVSLSKESIIDFLHPSNKLESASIEMWIDYTVNSVWTLRESLLVNSNGKIEITSNNEIKKEALVDLGVVLERVNTDLQFKTFLVCSNLTLADLILACSLKEIYEVVLDEKTISNFNNLTRWFKLVSNLKQYKAIYGDVKLKA